MWRFLKNTEIDIIIMNIILNVFGMFLLNVDHIYVNIPEKYLLRQVTLDDKALYSGYNVLSHMLHVNISIVNIIQPTPKISVAFTNKE